MLAAPILAELRSIVGDRALLTQPAQLQTYECDGLTGFRQTPAAVVLPQTADEVQRIVQLCAAHRIPFVARGAGTGLSGGSLPAAGSLVIALSRMTRVVATDLENGFITVEPGVTNAQVSACVRDAGLFFAPDPSSQIVCTIGGNLAENAGGAHCLKYGFTVTHVAACEVVLPTGQHVWLGSPHGAPDVPGYDLAGVFIGSEGTLGICTQAVLRVVPQPAAVSTLVGAFTSVVAAAQTVSDIIAAGLLPAAVEIMDRLSISAVEAAVHAGYPVCEALLIVELDGHAAQVAEGMQAVEQLARANGATELRFAHTADERAAVWRGRKAAFAAAGRISPNYIVQDGVIPRTQLPAVLQRMQAMADEAGLRVANVFHAGDGNLHPMVLYTASVPGEEARALAFSESILRLCVDAGGSLSGEHGIGREKQCEMSYMFAPPDLAAMQRVRAALDPHGIANPDKLFPTPRLCGERAQGPRQPHAVELAGLAEVF